MRKSTEQKMKKRNIQKPKRSIGSIDIPFLILVLFLLAFGLIMLSSASYVSALYKYGDSYYHIKRQAWFAVGGLVAMIITAFIDYKFLKKIALFLLVVSIILLIIVLIPGIGIKVNGARRWLPFGPVNIQPSEIGKFAIIVCFSAYISVNYNQMKKFTVGVLPLVVTLGLVAGLVAVETHLSGAILILSVGAILMFVGGTQLVWFGAATAAGVGALSILVMFTDYMKKRISIWRDPFSDLKDGGYQTVQALYAIGSGGLLGLGLGESRQKHLYIPEPQNDYIFAITAEELGFVGALMVILLFVILIWRGFVIAFHARDKFGSLLVIGIISRVAVQTILNIAVVTNAVPVTGVSLPFFSSGGTALIILLIEMGIVLSVSRFSYLDKT